MLTVYNVSDTWYDNSVMTGEDVKEFREKMGLTRPKFAEKVGYSAVHIFKIERGERKVPRVLIKLIQLMQQGTRFAVVNIGKK